MVRLLVIEGGSDTRNGSLRRGFHDLLSKEIQENLIPRIIMGDSKNESIKKFLTIKNPSNLLIDLDKDESFRDEDISNNNLQVHRDKVFYMIQEMEAWFLSQTDILVSYYPDIDWDDIRAKKVSEIHRPAYVLGTLTQKSKSRKYHKIKHAVELLPQLDTKKLAVDFPDFQRLLDVLRK